MDTQDASSCPALLSRLKRLYSVLSGVTRTITRKPGRVELLHDICRILVEVGGFRVAWIGAPDADGWIVPEAVCGATGELFETIRISVRDIPEGRGPTGTALRRLHPVISNNILTDPVMRRWHCLAEEYGVHSAACFPVYLPTGTVAALTLYAAEYDFFLSDEEQLLVEISATLGYALEFAATEEQRATQTEHLEQEVQTRKQSEAMLLAMQEHLAILNRELEERVADEVRKSRLKDQTILQNEKTVAIGQLAAGVAHEINNPLVFITNNLYMLVRYFSDIVTFDRLQQEQCRDVLPPQVRNSIDSARKALRLDYALSDGHDLISEMADGAQRISRIISNLRIYSAVDMQEYENIALTECLECVLILCEKELNQVGTIRKQFESVPEIYGNPGQLNQVFMSLLHNAVQAITPPGEITVRCWSDDDSVYAAITDTGHGIPAELHSRIFEPFFTTREVGRGPGLGLSSSYEIISNHHGRLEVESEVGCGSTFRVSIPRTMER